MKNARRTRAFRPLLAGVVALVALAVATSGCGGAGGSKTGDTLQGVVLVSFEQAGQDNLPLNRTLEFVFSSPIDPLSINPDSIQIREGGAFGLAVAGKYVVQADKVFFEPQLAGLCDYSDSGLHPDTDYRVTFIGSPEEFAVRSLAGDPLQATTFASFHTRPDTDPELFEDQIPGVGPVVTFTSPADQTADVSVAQGNRVEITFSENLDPCSINQNTILFYQYATGGPSGFSPSNDLTPGDPYTWGSGIPTSPPRRVRAQITLTQDKLLTRVALDPVFGEFPDNALLVVQVTAAVKDFGGLACAPVAFSFTTQNLPVRTGQFHMEFDGDVPILINQSTGEVNTSRSPSRAQGFLLFAGDGDNGPYSTAQTNVRASGPDNSRGPLGCTTPTGIPQPNDNLLDDYDTSSVTDLVLDTGATRNTCFNATDGSTAVVFEFRSFHVRPGSTVRIRGVNPAIILVQGDCLIEAGGRLLARGDGGGGGPQSDGVTGTSGSQSTPAGGTGVAGGGPGGDGSNQGTQSTPPAGFYSQNGGAGFGTTGYGAAKTMGGGGQNAGEGFGHGAVATDFTYGVNGNYVQPSRGSPGGGGGGHAGQGGTGQDNGPNTGTRTKQNAFADGVGGLPAGDQTLNPPDGIIMQTPEAGSGGGGGGDATGRPFATQNGFSTATYYRGTGGSGGAGGGFVDITARGNLRVLGTIDAAGGRGGNGAPAQYGFYGGGGGGGGGSGGAIRLLTPGMFFYDSTTTITTAGGNGGNGGGNVQPSAGGMGSWGRLAIETQDGTITKAAPGPYTLNSIPADGSIGFSRYPFHGQRFQGGGLVASVVTDVMDMGPVLPQFLPVRQDNGSLPPPATAPGEPARPRDDFFAGIPSVASRGVGKAGIFIEAKGYLANADGSVNVASDSGWKSVGYFSDLGTENTLQWNPAASPPSPADVPSLPPGNTGVDIASLSGREYVQFRITFYLPGTIGPFDPGPYIDSWDVYFTYDQ